VEKPPGHRPNKTVPALGGRRIEALIQRPPRARILITFDTDGFSAG